MSALRRALAFLIVGGSSLVHTALRSQVTKVAVFILFWNVLFEASNFEDKTLVM